MMADSVLKVIRSVVLFKACMNAGERVKLSKDMSGKLNKAYDKYLDADSSDEALQQLENVEDEMAQSLDWQRPPVETPPS